MTPKVRKTTKELTIVRMLPLIGSSKADAGNAGDMDTWRRTAVMETPAAAMVEDSKADSKEEEMEGSIIIVEGFSEMETMDSMDRMEMEDSKESAMRVANGVTKQSIVEAKTKAEIEPTLPSMER